jgi:hypothetical protein
LKIKSVIGSLSVMGASTLPPMQHSKIKKLPNLPLLHMLLKANQQMVFVWHAESLHLQFYTHETRGGPNGTILISAGAGAGGNFSSLGWGSFVVFDNVIKAGFASNSTLLGQVTGTTVLTTKAGWPVQFLAQMIFNENYKYNGSSFTVIPGGIILGGTGYLQNFTGYGQPVEVTTNPPDSGLHVYLWNVYLESK